MFNIKRVVALTLVVATITCIFTACSSVTEPIENSSSVDVGENLLKDDFYTAVNKEWLDKAKSNESQGYIDYVAERGGKMESFYDDYFKKLKTREDLSNYESKVLTLYNQSSNVEKDEMSEKALEYVNKIESIKTLADLEKLYQDERLSLYNNLFNISLTGNKDKYLLELSAIPMLGTKVTDFTLLYDEEAQLKYSDKVLSCMEYMGYDKDKISSVSQKALEIESKLAQNYIESISKQGGYGLHKSNSGFIFNIEFSDLLTSLGYDKDYQNIKCSDSYMDLLNEEILTEDNIDSLKAYFITSVLCRIAMESPIDNDSNKSFYNVCDYYIHDIMAKIYTDNNIKQEDIDNVNKVADSIINVYKEKISDLSYLSDSTKIKAKKKLDNINVIVAIPKTVINIENADISEKNTYCENLENCLLNQRIQYNQLLKQEYSRDKVIFDTLEVNAYYVVSSNAIIIDSAMLQEPVYDRNKTFEENLAGIGTVVAHEISHSLDINGSEYDENGEYTSWWNVNDRKAYIEETNKIRDFMLEQGKKDGLELNSTNTRGEDIADLTGVQCCVEVLKKLDSPDYKMFFEKYATLWRSAYSESEQKALIKYDTHSLSKYRVNVPLQQIDEFYDTFNIQKGDGMYVEPSKRISVW